jgi:hypothetical protein
VLRYLTLDGVVTFTRLASHLRVKRDILAERTFLLLLFSRMETKDKFRWKIGWSALGMLIKYVISTPTLPCFVDKLLGKALWFALFEGWTRPFAIGYVFSQKLMYVS